MLNLSIAEADNILRPRITVMGVGGAGGNAVNNMIRAQLEGCDFVAANTDARWPPPSPRAKSSSASTRRAAWARARSPMSVAARRKSR